MIAQNQKKNLILVFDTNIFLIGIDFNVIPSKIYTIPQIIEEIEVAKFSSKNRNIINRIRLAIENGKLTVKEPHRKYINHVKASASKTGDIGALSKADQILIALALELKDSGIIDVILYSNDYSIQNCCLDLNIKTKNLMKPGIKRGFQFEVYCPICQTSHPSNALNKICENCGAILKRRPIVN